MRGSSATKSSVCPGSRQRSSSSGVEELRDRRADLAVGAEDDVREALRAPRLRLVLERLHLGPRELLRHGDVAHGLRVGEDAELGAARRLGRLLDLHPEAQVGPVDAEAQHRLVVAHPLERRLELHADALAPDAHDDPLHQREQELAVGERHLDVELRQLLEPVGARILVAHAARDLVVALEPGDDEQLLRDLRRLRQRVELARLQARRDDEVARALGRRLPEHRRLDVDEALALHLLADDPDELRARADVPLHVLAPQIEPAVLHAQRLVDVLLVELERQRRRRRDDGQLLDLELDLAGRHLRVHGLGRAAHDRAARLEDELVADAVRDARRVGRVLGVHDELRHAGLVAKVDEDEAAVVAAPRRPAGERDGPALVLGPRLAATEVSAAHAPRLAASSSRVVGSSPPGRTMRTPSPSTTTVVFAPSRAACVSCPFFERPA